MLEGSFRRQSHTAELAQAQESNARIRKHNAAVLFTLYTEHKTETLGKGIAEVVSCYFKGATMQSASGLWEGKSELAAVIYIVGTRSDLQKVFDLAGDLQVTQDVDSVLVTWQEVKRYDVNRGR